MKRQLPALLIAGGVLLLILSGDTAGVDWKLNRMTEMHNHPRMRNSHDIEKDTVRELIRAYRDKRLIDFGGEEIPFWIRKLLEEELQPRKHHYLETDEPIVGHTEYGAPIRVYRCACGVSVEVTAEQQFYMSKGACPGEGTNQADAGT